MNKKEASFILANIDRRVCDDELIEALDMAIKALEILEEFEKAQIITGGRLNGRTYAYKCGLEDGKRKALEQKHCEDCISRKEAILEFQRYGVGCFDPDDFSVEQCTRFVISKLRDLPPVTPQQKTGHWIDCEILNEVKCSSCRLCFGQESNYCPNCGAKMIESEIEL